MCSFRVFNMLVFQSILFFYCREVEVNNISQTEFSSVRNHKNILSYLILFTYMFPSYSDQLVQPARLQQGMRRATNFFDRVSQNPMVMQLVDPRWWLNQDWRGMFRNDGPVAKSDSTTLSPITGQPVLMPLPANI